MSSLPPSFAVSLLACIAWSAGFVGCSPAVIDAGRAPSQQAGTNDSQPMTATSKHGTALNQKTATVKIDQFAFEPASLTVAPGTMVEWTNHDDVPHTVVEKKVRFKSQALDTDDVYRYTFKNPGTYQYFCSVHPHMVGEIHVKQ